ncbi:MAG: M20 family metallo-hydrolase [Bacteroidaceae bacterium]|nr:M20 family metallo-hydrolase [Bacteroidaceae bacterium]
MKEAVELLKKLVAIPRQSREETAAADFLMSFLDGKGLRPQREANNLWCVADGYDPLRPTLLLNAHIDTVRPVAGWTRDPYLPELTPEGKLFGIGTNDDGASLVSLIQTFRILSRRPQSYNLVFLASAEEEVSGANGAERALPLLPHIDVALVGEPTGMEPAVAEKGLMVLDAVVRGRAGHAAREEGLNAIYGALPAIEWFRTFRFPKVSPLLGAVKTSVTIVNAGTQHNVVPDQCRFTIDVRTNELYSNREVFEFISDSVRPIVAATGCTLEIKERSFRLNSSRIDTSHPLVQRAIALGKKPFGSPTLSDQALMPFLSMKMGPGQSSRSHTADEFICIEEIRNAIDSYVHLLDGLNICSSNLIR